jgi:hypothetical protein
MHLHTPTPLMHLCPHLPTRHCPHLPTCHCPQIWILEKQGGSLVGGAIKLFQDRKANPPPPRNPRLPAKPQGQTVGSFKRGLQMLPEAIQRNIKDNVRCVCVCGWWGGMCVWS